MKKPKLTQKVLDDIYSDLIKHGAQPLHVADADVPRFQYIQRKISKKRAMAIRQKEIDELKRDLAELRARPLQTTEGYYKRINKGDAGYLEASYEYSNVARASLAHAIKKKAMK